MLSFRIALRYLFSKKSHNAVNIISIISMIGVGVATAAIVCVLSVFNGFSSLTSYRLNKVNPDLLLLPSKGKTVANAHILAEEIASLPEVKAAIPTIREQALAMYANRQMPVTVLGFLPEHSVTSDIASLTIDGHYIPCDTVLKPVALSIGVAARLGARPGMGIPLALYAPRRVGRISLANPMGAFTSDSLTITAVFEVQQTEFDTQTIVVPYTVAQHLFDYSTQASSIYIALKSGVTPGRGESAVLKKIGNQNYRILTAARQEEVSFRMIEIEKWMTFAMLTFILVIACFNVISTLSMIIIEKRDNMATMKALGASSRQIRNIFVCEGWLITLLGGIGGIMLGVALVLAQQYGEFIKLGADPATLTITSYPVRLQLPDLLLVFILIAFVGYFIGLFASRLAKTR